MKAVCSTYQRHTVRSYLPSFLQALLYNLGLLALVESLGELIC